MNRATRILLVLLVGLATSALLAWAVYQRVLRPAQAREEAFAAIAAGRLMPGPGGVVVLPPPWEVASIDGRAYVTGSPGRMIWALFLKERGDGARLRGYLYCNKPATTGKDGAVDLAYPIPAGPGGKPPARAEVTVKVVRALSPSSYEVVNDKP